MARQIIKQPNGLYAEYSTIVDAFVLWDATPEEVIAKAREAAADDAEKRTREALSSAGEGTVPFLGLSWEDALENHNRNYPEDRIESNDQGRATSGADKRP